MKHVIRSVLLVCLLLIALLSISASAAPADFVYTMKGNGTAIITGYNGNDVNVYIPKMLDGYTVSTIADNAFEGNKTMMTVNIPDTVTSIGDKAFFECENLNGVTIPASVQSIGIGAFAGCDKGLSFAVDKANPVYTTIDQILYNKKTKTLVCCPRRKQIYKETIPNGIIEIGDYAFYEYSKVFYLSFLPESVKRIKTYAFADSYEIYFSTSPVGTRSVDIYTLSVDIIEAYAFKGTGLYVDLYGNPEISITASIIDEYAFLNSRIGYYGIGGTANSNLSLSINIPEIKDHSFEGCILPNTCLNTTIIGDYAFKNANICGDISLPDSVKRIGKEAFMCEGREYWHCIRTSSSGTPQIVLPASLESIGEKAFYFSFERTIIIPESVTEIGDNICDRKYGTLEVVSGSYAATYAAENGYKYMYSGEDDLSWLN